MKKSIVPYHILVCCLVGLLSNNLSAQLGFCEGSSGVPIFTEDFGSGLTDGPALPAGTTSYDFTTGTPTDGEYTISSTTNYFDWPNVADRTPGDTNGKSFIVNASFTAGEFYQRRVANLCENTTYEFSAWLVNLQPPNSCEGNAIPINVRFQIWDATDTDLLAQGDTGNIPNIGSPEWEQYALVFQTLADQTEVILKMRNNSNGGCGNDLAIDDISFSACGDNITLTDPNNVTETVRCQGQGDIAAQTLSAIPDFSVFTNHAYQWQQSTDQVVWENIVGETTSTYTTPEVTTTTYFRARVAEDVINVNNDLCSVISDVFSAIIVPIPEAPISNGNISICQNEPDGLSVAVPSGIRVNWYSAATGGTLLAENTSTFVPDAGGTYYAESITEANGCISTTRTAVTFTINPLPQVSDERLELCDGESTSLSAGVPNATYLWSSGETTPDISVSAAGTYTVTVTNLQGCSAIRTIEILPVEIPIIQSITSEGNNIVVTLENEGDFEFSLDINSFQPEATFENIPGGRYRVNIAYGNDCGVVTQSYIHVVIQDFFTPNGDGINDTFAPEGVRFFTAYNLAIFDRYGQLLHQSLPNQATWNGTRSGNPIPEGNYWYTLTLDDTVKTGYFLLKR